MSRLKLVLAGACGAALSCACRDCLAAMTSAGSARRWRSPTATIDYPYLGTRG